MSGTNPSAPNRRHLLEGVLVLLLLVTACSSADNTEVAVETVSAEPVEVIELLPPEPTTSPDTTEAPAAQLNCGAAMTTGVNEITLTTDGVEYETRVFVPSSALENELLPAVIVWHGLTFDGPTIASYTGFEDLAEKEGFLAVFPTGHPFPEDPTFSLGNGWELPDWKDSSSKNDVGFATDLLDELGANWCADPEHIFSVGDSLGGFFTSVIVCELADRIAAAASVSGVIHDESCVPPRSVPYMAIHGTADDIVPFETGGTSIFGEGAVPELGPKDSFELFVDDFGCDAEPNASEIGENTTRLEYTACDGSVPLAFYIIEGDGHTWPGSVGIGETTTNDFKATEVIWDFFKE